MPLYEYGCTSCGFVTDIRHGFDEKPDVKCERCGASLVRRFSAAPIVFKGSGFYVTDSRKSSKSDSSEKSGKADTSTKSDSSKDGGSSTSSETKSAETKSGDSKTGEAKSKEAAA